MRDCLRRLGIRYRGNVKKLHGTPDFVLYEKKKAIFVNGCFWHGHQACRRAARPETNRFFWDKKIDGNKARDRRNIRLLKNDGWSVLVIWQCQIKNESQLMKKLLKFAER